MIYKTFRRAQRLILYRKALQGRRRQLIFDGWSEADNVGSPSEEESGTASLAALMFLQRAEAAEELNLDLYLMGG